MSILFLMKQSCDIYTTTIQGDGDDGWPATPSYSSVKCRKEETRKQKQKPDGKTVMTEAVFFLPPATVIGVGDKVVIDSENYIVVDSQPIRVVTKVTHVEADCTRLSDE